MMLVPMPDIQLGSMQMMQEVSEHVGMEYPEITDSGYVAQPVDDSSFLGKRRWDQLKTPSH